MLKKISLSCGLIAVLIWGCYSLLHQRVDAFLSQPVNVTNAELFSVKHGQSLRALLVIFQQKHWLDDAIGSHFIHRFYPQLTHIKAGTYQIHPGESFKVILSRFVAGDEFQFSITMIEGSRFKDWLNKLSQSPHLQHTLSGLTEPEIAEKLGISHKKLEGLFLAETYHFTDGTSDLDILQRAHVKLNQVLNQAWQNKAEHLPLKSPYEALILASIIEKETSVDAERKRIASVFVNRLNKKMRLQTDPTVIYGMGDQYNGNIRKKDLRTPTPYNTYVIRGLPPTPIATVGVASLQAVMNPEKTNYLYFVASGQGGHVFSKSLSEHNRAVRNYLKQLRNK
ncbi:putative aminodeoxychorismate lyase [Vibrio aerogenes CECT 7868]|uniref:Endolytic murein transglycosylase n=1 Tax=Vibrio aerogenes CECT 7868 TaxID=1216006 RepID=A0A1M6D9Y5_9VIBR|nr:endolytic transglycosylase MltG [Vibrio aerogenes]SHI69838.1 putative aminodeoxychorismate lyase [Vibrio aerogenes CECT 7868]